MQVQKPATMHPVVPSTVRFIHIMLTFFIFASGVLSSANASVVLIPVKGTLVHSSENATEITTSNNSTQNLPEYLQGKDDSLFNCKAITLELGEYELFPNGTVYIKVYNISLNESFYIHLNDFVTLCSPYKGNTHVEKDLVSKSSLLTLVGMSISMICLILHLVAFAIVPDMRNLPGWNLAGLCLSLLFSYCLLFTVMSEAVTNYRDICVTFASLIHFFLLSAFLWMSIMSFDVFISVLRDSGSFKVTSTQFRWKKFASYCLFVFGVALILSVLAILADVIEAVPKSYRPAFEEMCWFSQKTPLLIFFGGPVTALTCLNFMFFALSTYTINRNKMKCLLNRTTFRRNYLMYFRLSVIMGITWTVGILAPIINVDWLWYLFVFLNTLQGLFIFLAFTCSGKVQKVLRLKLMGEGRGFKQIFAKHFHRYCFCLNSIEKDLDNIVDTDRKEKGEINVTQL